MILLLLQGDVAFIAYSIQQYCIQLEMKLALENESSQTETLTLSRNRYEESRIGPHEISLDGRMYDIKSAEVYIDSVKLVAINDDEEEDLVEKIKKLKKTQGSGGMSSHLEVLFSTGYISAAHVGIVFHPEVMGELYPSGSDAARAGISSISTPPPRLG